VRNWCSILRPLGCRLSLSLSVGWPAAHPEADGSRLASAAGFTSLDRIGFELLPNPFEMPHDIRNNAGTAQGIEQASSSFILKHALFNVT
jgi:hypothetical protein